MSSAVTPPSSEVRKTVTIIFCDLKGSTALGERLDSEALREILGRYFDVMKGILERHGGTVEKFIGDAVMAVFGLPRLHEDDALRAVRAAWEMQRTLERLNAELEAKWGAALINRIGVNTGEVVADDASAGQRLVTGDAVNVAARLEQAAGEFQTLLGETTYELVRDAVIVEPVEPLELKGKSQRVNAFWLKGVGAGLGVARHLERPLVGREEELRALSEAFDRVVAGRTCELVTVVGEAGLGKTRLVEEFFSRAASRARVLRGHCLSYGDGITFWPLAEVVQQAAGIVDGDVQETACRKLGVALADDSPEVCDRLAAAIGLSRDAFPIQETYWAARKFAEKMAAGHPLVILFDDIHWAETTMLELIEHLVGTATDAPIFLVATARQELFDDHPRWMKGKPNAATISLRPLTDDEGMRIVTDILGPIGLPGPIQERVIGAAEGNPLFVEQMVSSLVDDGLLQTDDAGQWVLRREAGDIDVPPTINALLAARIDKLAIQERTVIETGSVAGVVFHRGSVEELVAQQLRDRVATDLESLTGKQFLDPAESSIANDIAYRFHHILIRDAAYSRLLKRTRADLHERFGDWLERAVATRILEYEEIIGYHLEQSYRYRNELGPLDDRAKETGLRAAARLGAAGRRAIARGDMPAAANLIGRAIALLPERSHDRLELAADHGEVLRESGDFKKADELLRAAIVDAEAVDDTDARAALMLAHLLVRKSTEPAGWRDIALEESKRSIAYFERIADHASLARAWRLLGTIHGSAGRYAAAEEAVQRAVEEARQANDRRQETRSLPLLALNAVYGPEPVVTAIEKAERLIERATGDRRAESMLVNAVSLLYAMNGQFTQARELYQRGRATLEDLGGKVQASITALFSGRVELLAADYAAAEARIRPDYDRLRSMGERLTSSTLALLLGEAVYAQDRFDEAEALSHVGEDTASKEDFDSQFRWRCLRAKLLARSGAIAEAETLAHEAVRIVQQGDSPAKQADALLALAEVQRAAGRDEQVIGLLQQAKLLYDSKGDIVSARRVSALSETVRGGALRIA